jgi:predicted nucleotidyltransferase
MTLAKEIGEIALYQKTIIFGSIAKVENTKDSDIDIFLDIPEEQINLSKIEKNFGRKIQIHFKDSLKNKNLKENIEKGIRIRWTGEPALKKEKSKKKKGGVGSRI